MTKVGQPSSGQPVSKNAPGINGISRKPKSAGINMMDRMEGSIRGKNKHSLFAEGETGGMMSVR